MTTIDRYIGVSFISSYVIVLLVFVSVYVFGDILANLDDFTGDRSLGTSQVLLNIADYYGHNLPLYYHQLGGLALAVAAAFTFAMMLRNNELTAMAAAGVPLQRLAAPVLACSVLLVGLWMANSELIVPRFAQRIARQRSDLRQSEKAEVKCVRDAHNAVLVAQELVASAGILRRVYVVEPTRSDGTRRLIRADAARYDPQRQVWMLDRGAQQVLRVGAASLDARDESARWEPLAEYAFTLSPEEIRLRQSSQWADLISVGQMNQLLHTQRLPNLPTIARARDVRVTEPLVAWILLLLAIPFFLTRESTDVLVAGGKALLMCGACFAFTYMMQSAGTGNYMQFAVWSPVLVFGPIAVVHFANVKT